ncbi:hypothetical protein V2A60_008357 [Cordyceps javanica]
MAGEQIPNNLLLHEILEEQARRLSENVALEFYPDVKMTFGKLNREANRLARYLKERKTLDSEVIAVCFEKSPQLIVSIIAILKAGMAWVPIPTDAPAARISSILSACGARLALCFGPARHIVEDLAPVIVLDDVLDDADFLAYPDTNLACDLKSSDLCQILFTSGSTGVPKGVAIEHRAMMHCVWGMVNEFGLTAKTRTLQFSAPTFDAFTLDVFMSIACGGCLVMATPSTMLADMTVFVRNSRATYAHITPTVLDMIDPLGVPEFETLSSTGEALSENLANRWRTRVRLFNSYGPTETLVCTIQYLGGNRIDSACIGKAVPGLEVCLLEPGESNEVASGNVGEICVAGPHLFRGYVSAEKLSKGQLAKSECLRNGTRYYRTGDMGKMEACPGGGHTLRYLGRRDSQVKIHGIRTDLSDIERSITACEAFQNCIVVFPRSGPSQGRVCCLFTLRLSSTTKLDSKPQNAQCLGDSVEILSACGICASALRRGQDVAAAKLPTHALPTSWWAVKEFPRTSSGKVDRVKLRSLLEGLENDDYIQHLNEMSRTAQVQSSPPDIVEKQLLSLWADVLDRPMSTIDKTVSFTQFGADSLDVIRLISKARAQGIDLDIPQIYASKTIQQLAGALEPHLHQQATARKSVYRPFSAIPIDLPLGVLMQKASTVCQIGVEDIEDIFGTTQYQTGLMSLDLKSPGTYVCEFSWTLLKEIKIENFRSSWEALIADEPVLRSRLIWDETRDGLWQLVVRHREVSWSEEYFAASMSLGDDLCRGFVKWHDELQRWKFFLKIHHSLTDGWSLQLMLNRLRAMYVGEDTQPPRRLSFAEFMCHRIEDESLKRESSPRFWSKYLEACTQLHFPPSPPETHHEVHATGHHSLEITGSFKETAASFGVTQATLLYASVALLLSVNADSEDVTFGLILTGRDSPLDGIFDMIGPAFTIFPLRATVAGSTTMQSFLKLIESHITNIIPHQNYGLQRIRQCGEGAARACDFRCLVIVQPEDENFAGKGLWEEVHGQTSGHAESVPLTLELILYDGKILVNCSFDSAFLCEEDVSVLLSQLGHALKHLETSTSRNELLVSQVKLEGQDEQLRFMNWAKRHGASVDSCLHELCFNNLEYADRVAIDDQGTHQQITYQELDAFSNRLRNHIQLHHPIAPETIVPVVLNKSPLAIITILAVLKAGGAYVPIDSNWPIRRVQHIIKETGASVLLLCSPDASGQYRETMDEVTVVDLTEFSWKKESLRAQHDGEVKALERRVVKAVSSTNLACILYTSGSTVSEMIRPSLIRKWSQRVRLLNAYGSTETSIVTSITDPISLDVSPTNIGLNVAAWHWIVRRDSTGAIYSVPRGCVGEIAVTGLTLARGYVNNPGLTERRFVEAPHLTVGLATSRVYLTGDIGKYTADGCICLLGRNDQMVKVNGIRVEPGESEQQLQQHGGIFASCAVQWLQDEQSNAKLAAFVPINSAKSEDLVASDIIAVEEMTQAFRESCRRAQLQLQDLLPVQYIPTLFIPIRRIPRTTSGKVDLKLLKARLQELPSFSGLFCVNKGQKQPTGEPPATLAEIALESSFRQIFGNKQQYHTNVDFFALGGDSFSSIKLVSAARKHGWEISVQQVYRHPRLRDLAAVASLARKHHKALPAFCMVNSPGLEHNVSVAAEKCGVKEAQILDLYPCTAMQEALMISSAKSSGGFFDQQVFQLADGTSSETLITALQSVWARHAILRTRIILDDEYRSVQVVVQEKLEIDQVTDETLAEYLRKDAALIPGYGDKLSRCAMLSCTSGVFLVISQHHTIYDAWSMNLVLADIKHQYLATDVSRELPPAFSSFIHYVTELHKAPEAQNFWRQYLKGSSVTALPQVRMGEPFEGNQKYSMDMQLPIHDRHSLATMAEAAWGLLLCRYTGLENVTFGCVRTGRSAPIDNIDAIVGPTIVTVPRRISAPHGEQVSSYLEMIEASIVDSIPWEQYGHRNIRKLSSGAHKEQQTQDICGYINENKIQLAFLTPTITTNVLLTPWRVPTLKTLYTSSEPFSQTLLERWGPNVRLVNLYGLTESCLHATMNENMTIATDANNIGHPLASHVWVVDTEDFSRLAPVGCRGELLISGPTLACGYLSRDETAQAEIIDGREFSWALPGESRFYATGDIVRQNPDGSINHIAKKGQSPKLNGMPIEFKDIENEIERCEGIVSAMVEKFVLAYGGCVCIPSEQDRMGDLQEVFARMRINFVDLTPTVAHLLNPAALPMLTALTLAGEMADQALIERWSHREPPLEVFVNSYGPTEAAISCAIGEISPEKPPGHVGKRLGGYLWIVDEEDHEHLVPIGSVGELVVSGPTLARGYLNDADKTNAAFIRNVHWIASQEDQIIYKTGDLARFDFDGNVEILGRKDDGQIKLNGLRIEVGEIEYRMKSCSSLSKVRHVAVAKLKHSGHDILAAFLQFSDCKAISSDLFTSPSETFRQATLSASHDLQHHLPQYMIPKLWIPVPSWPLNAAGKTDKKRLVSAAEALPPAQIMKYLQASNAARKSDETNIKTAAEKVLESAWKQVLSRKDDATFELHDDFFAVGGDSLRTIMLISLLKTKGIQVTAQDIFGTKTLKLMAGKLSDKNTEYAWERDDSVASDQDMTNGTNGQRCLATTVNGITDASRKGEMIPAPGIEAGVEDVYPASHLQLSYLIEGQKWCRAYYCWFFIDVGQSSILKVREACATVAMRHQILRTSFYLVGHECHQAVQKLAPNFKVLFSSFCPADWCEQLDKDVARPVSFGEVLTRFRLLIDADTGRRVLALGLSHAQYDGFCTPTILNDLSLAYGGKSWGDSSPPRYRDFIKHTTSLCSDEADCFWRERLKGSTLTSIVRPVGCNARPVMRRDSKHTIAFEFNNSGTSSYPVMLKVAWAIALSQMSQSSDITFGNLVSGRYAAFEGAQEVVGPCLNVIPFRVRIGKTESFSNLLKEAHDQTIATIPFEATPFDRIAAQSPWPAATAGFNSIFQFQNIPGREEGDQILAGSDWKKLGSAVYGGGVLQSGACWLTAWPTVDGTARFLLRYSEETLDTSDAEILMQSFIRVLKLINNDPGAGVASLSGLYPSIRTKQSRSQVSPAPGQLSTSSGGRAPSLATISIMEELKSIWRSVLGLDGEIKPEDSFFDVGGDSIAAARMVSACARMGLKMSLQDVIDFPSLISQADCVAAKAENSRKPEEELKLVYEDNYEFISDGEWREDGLKMALKMAWL